MIKGVLAGFLAYGLFSCADACVKALSGRLSIFQVGFFITLASLSTFGFGRAKSERWREVFVMNRPWLVLARAGAGIISGFFGIYAFKTLPFAEAYSVLFLMPLFATMLSIPLLGEQIGWRRWAAVGIGFFGVMLVVRPGFHQLQPGHFSAAVAAVFAAISMITLRKVGPTEKRISMLAVLYLSALTVNGLLMLTDFRPVTRFDVMLVIIGGVFGGFGQIFMLTATRLAPPNRVAPAQYIQIVWAILLGAIFFAEYPDPVAFAGMALVALSGLFTFFREEQLRGWSRRTMLMKNRP
jgi:S-adenosylmethionine uptake transporter